MITERVRVLKLSLMVRGMMVPSKKGLSMEKVTICLMMAPNTMVIGLKISWMAWGCIFGQMGENILENGGTIRCMAQACISGPMAESTRDNIQITRSTVLVLMNTRMGEPTRAGGSMESSTGQESKL